MYYKITIERLDNGFAMVLDCPKEANVIANDKIYVPTLDELKKRLDDSENWLSNPIIAIPIPEKDEWT